MKILHYALGFPPYRSGGMTKLCVDLMVQQAREGHCLALLWPGQMGVIVKKTAIKNNGKVKIEDQNIQSFEIINPLPVPFDEGIADFRAYTSDSEKNKNIYKEFLNEFCPDVIHVHTLMGLHKGFLTAAKERNIRLVFTAHDFFPICPKVTIFRHGEVCSNVYTCAECGVCNATALSLKKIQILQSPIYRGLKDSWLVKKIRKKHRDVYLREAISDELSRPVGEAKDYKNLRDYYYSFLQMMDVIHYNSNVTKKVYESFFDLHNSRVISITHADIKDNRVEKVFYDDRLRIRYLGSQSGAKGFLLLKSALDQLWGKQQDFCLDIHFCPTEMAPYMKVHERYTYKNLKSIFADTDILVAPSIWYETFGFTVLEALSYGVPVIISGTVGAKDIISDGAGMIIDDISPEKLCEVLQKLTIKKLKDMNTTILKKQHIMKIDELSEQIQKKCYG